MRFNIDYKDAKTILDLLLKEITYIQEDINNQCDSLQFKDTSLNKNLIMLESLYIELNDQIVNSIYFDQ